MTGSAKQFISPRRKCRLLRRVAPRNDVEQKARPKFRPGLERTLIRRSASSVADFSVADLVAAETPAVTVPEALALPVAARRRGWRPFDVDRCTAGGDRSAHNGAADQSGGYARGDATLRARGRRGERTADRCDRKEGDQGLLHFSCSLEMAPREGAGLEGTLDAEFPNSLWRKQSARTVNAG